MNRKNTGLGKGLGALLGDASATKPIATPPPSLTNQEIPVHEIEANPFQPRQHFDEEALEGLAESIKIHGIIQPITVRRLNEHRYQLIAGERRYTAAKLAGLTLIPAHIRTADDQNMLEMALIENIQRENLNPIEIALSYQRLISEINLKQEELGNRVGKKRTTVTNYLRLLKLPPSIQAALRDGKISMGHAKALINIADIAVQLHIFQQILTKELSVRQAEELAAVQTASTRKNNPATKTEEKPLDADQRAARHLQEQLSTHFGTKIHIQSKGKQGEIRIPFFSAEDLERILNLLNL